MKTGILFRKESLWIGAHYSPYNRRWCINLIPFVTFWLTLKGGRTPNNNRAIYMARMLERKIIEHGQRENEA